MPSESTNVFVSYSRADALLVSPVVKLLRVNKSLVFQDIDAIQPGKRWQGEIAKALTESQLVVVFWCTHASRSNEVSKEGHAAIEQKKDLLPLLLDTTPLPPELAEFQWIDFRGTVGQNHSWMNLRDSEVERRAPAPPVSGTPLRSARSSVRWLLLTAGAAVFGIVACLGWLFSRQTGPSSGALPTIPTVGPTSSPISTAWPAATVAVAPPSTERFGLGLSPLLLLGISLALAVCLIWLLRRRWKRVTPIAIHKRHLGDIERHIASELEAEILRRTTLRREGGK
jgi:TIR domain-containing protein